MVCITALTGIRRPQPNTGHDPAAGEPMWIESTLTSLVPRCANKGFLLSDAVPQCPHRCLLAMLGAKLHPGMHAWQDQHGNLVRQRAVQQQQQQQPSWSAHVQCKVLPPHSHPQQARGVSRPTWCILHRQGSGTLPPVQLRLDAPRHSQGLPCSAAWCCWTSRLRMGHC